MVKHLLNDQCVTKPLKAMNKFHNTIRISSSDINKANQQMIETEVISVDQFSGGIIVNSRGAKKTITPRLSDDKIKCAWEKATASE